jgi:hypothetical protein
MSLEQVKDFYEILMSNQEIYEQYYNNCCLRGLFGVWNWDKTKIVNFAATLGYSFTESELDAALFSGELGDTEEFMSVRGLQILR